MAKHSWALPTSSLVLELWPENEVSTKRHCTSLWTKYPIVELSKPAFNN